MDTNTVMKNKENFLALANKNIKRKGIENLLKWLEKTDFFTAPASTKYHSYFEGGLCEHSLKVYDNLCHLVQWKMNSGQELDAATIESITIIALFHDISKIGKYEISFRNSKNEKGEWEKVPYYAYTNEKSKILLGHAETSICMLQKFLLLTLEEATSIRWHMGAYDTSVKGGDREYSAALQKCPIAMLTHIANDMSATLDEVQ